MSLFRRNASSTRPVVRSEPMAETLESRTLFAGNTWYVWAGNTQPNRTGSSTNPFQTIQSAVNAATTGDKIWVRPGDYNEIVTFQSKDGITLQRNPNYPLPTNPQSSDRINVSSSAVKSGHGVIDVISSSNITVQDLTVKNSSWSAFEIFGGSNITIQNNRTLNNFASSFHTNNASPYGTLSNVKYIGNLSSGDCQALSSASSTTFTQENVSMAGVNGFNIEYNDIGYSPVATTAHGGEGIDNKGSSHGTILHNTLHDFKEKAIYVGSYTDDTTDVEVAYNKVYNCVQGINVNSENGGTVSNYRIHDNLIYNNKDQGIIISKFNQPTAPMNKSGTRSDISIVNNTVYNNGYTPTKSGYGGGILVQGDFTISNIRIYNNLAVKNANWQIAVSTNANLSAIDFKKNLVNGTYSYSSTDPNNPQYGQGVYSNGPFFTNESQFDFTLLSNSPAVNGGYPSSTYVSKVAFNKSRTDATPDVGAFEY